MIVEAIKNGELQYKELTNLWIPSTVPIDRLVKQIEERKASMEAMDETKEFNHLP